MEIVVKDTRNLMKCKDISEGELLIYEGGVYLKTSTIDYYTRGGSNVSVKGNVIHLRTGTIGFIDDNAECEFIKGTLQVER